TGMKFLSISVDARAAGMANAVTSIEGGGESLFYNPAAMGWHEGAGNVALGRTMWIADIDYDYAAASFSPSSGQYGVFAVSLMFAQYGELQETIRFNNEQGFLDIGTFKPTAWAAGFGYAKAVTDRFSVGGQVKYVQQDLGNSIVDFEGETGYLRSDNSEGVVAFDLGMFYRTGFRSLNFAVSARNFAAEIEYEEESFQLPLTLMIGVSMDMFDLIDISEDQSFYMTVDAVNPRDFSEQIKFGAEYKFMEILALRAGYAFQTDEEGISLGGGLTPSLGNVGFAIDYAYTDFGVFSEVQRLTLKFQF
ncbi:MAG TPA: PorV/PorQ family protein, partial [Rhodothermales bacterium]|nr:PorV/PorQ family protein [Rhodothermales bacterium]